MDTGQPTRTKPAVNSTTGSAPIVIDLGRQKRKRVRQLRQGRGKLMDELSQMLVELKQAGSIGETAQPVVVVTRVRKRSGFPKWLTP